MRHLRAHALVGVREALVLVAAERGEEHNDLPLGERLGHARERQRHPAAREDPRPLGVEVHALEHLHRLLHGPRVAPEELRQGLGGHLAHALGGVRQELGELVALQPLHPAPGLGPQLSGLGAHPLVRVVREKEEGGVEVLVGLGPREPRHGSKAVEHGCPDRGVLREAPVEELVNVPRGEEGGVADGEVPAAPAQARVGDHDAHQGADDAGARPCLPGGRVLRDGLHGDVLHIGPDGGVLHGKPQKGEGELEALDGEGVPPHVGHQGTDPPADVCGVVGGEARVGGRL
mmetsp:Transcript_15338/g.39019  ORF Transcript_15338/g.39019 Transcript_15338/m.39019 type:complete len:289 (+) Transcript_15338:3692-4558(+)